MLGAAKRQKDVSKPEAYKDASLSQTLILLWWPDCRFRMSLSRYSRAVHRMGCLQSFPWNFVVRILERLSLSSKAREIGPAYSGINCPLALLDLAAVLKTAPESQLVKGPPGRYRELSTVRHSRTLSGLTLFSLISFNSPFAPWLF